MKANDPRGPRTPGTETQSSHPPVPSRRLVSLSEAARILGVSLGTARRLVQSGRVPVVRLSRRLLVDLRDLDTLIAGSKERVGW
jgi:excisionase family DNA binding protein